MDRAREYLDRRTAIAMLATTDVKGMPEVCILIATQVSEGGKVAGGEEQGVSGNAFRNLRRDPRASILVLDPIMDPRARDGVRIQVEFLGAELDGEELQRLADWLSNFAPGRHVVRRLLFKILHVENFRPHDVGPVLLQ